jgi:hypothetical protein
LGVPPNVKGASSTQEDGFEQLRRTLAALKGELPKEKRSLACTFAIVSLAESVMAYTCTHGNGDNLPS